MTARCADVPHQHEAATTRSSHGWHRRTKSARDSERSSTMQAWSTGDCSARSGAPSCWCWSHAGWGPVHRRPLAIRPPVIEPDRHEGARSRDRWSWASSSSMSTRSSGGLVHLDTKKLVASWAAPDPRLGRPPASRRRVAGRTSLAIDDATRLVYCRLFLRGDVRRTHPHRATGWFRDQVDGTVAVLTDGRAHPGRLLERHPGHGVPGTGRGPNGASHRRWRLHRPVSV